MRNVVIKSDLTVSINQPYFLPYGVFFKMLNSSDVFISLDDVNFRKKSFITRNIFVGAEHNLRFSIPLSKASQNKKINEIYTFNWPDYHKILRTKIESIFRGAQGLSDSLQIFDALYYSKDVPISKLNTRAIEIVCDYYNIKTQIISSSSIKEVKTVGEDRIIELCHRVGARRYLNLPGGKDLYNNKTFEENGLKIEFMEGSKINNADTTEFVRNASVLSAIAYGVSEL